VRQLVRGATVGYSKGNLLTSSTSVRWNWFEVQIRAQTPSPDHQGHSLGLPVRAPPKDRNRNVLSANYAGFAQPNNWLNWTKRVACYLAQCQAERKDLDLLLFQETD